MAGFKDMAAHDRATVFLDPNFLGETVRIEGREVCIVLDEDALKERQNGQDLAVAESSTLFYARVEDLPHRRAPGQCLNVNGRECIVDSWSQDMGMATVVLRENIVM